MPSAVDGVDGYSYTAEVCDYAEPGRGTDTFAICVDNGYDHYGVLSGGNIQLH